MENCMRLNLIIFMLMTIVMFQYIDLLMQHSGRGVKCYDLVSSLEENAKMSMEPNISLTAKTAEDIINSPANYRKRIISSTSKFICFEN